MSCSKFISMTLPMPRTNRKIHLCRPRTSSVSFFCNSIYFKAPLRSKDTQVAILHQQRGVVNSEDALMAETEESCPAIVAVAPQVSLTIRIPVCDDARCPATRTPKANGRPK